MNNPFINMHSTFLSAFGIQETDESRRNNHRLASTRGKNLMSYNLLESQCNQLWSIKNLNYVLNKYYCTWLKTLVVWHSTWVLFAGDREVSVRRDVWLWPWGQSHLVWCHRTCGSKRPLPVCLQARLYQVQDQRLWGPAEGVWPPDTEGTSKDHSHVWVEFEWPTLSLC